MARYTADGGDADNPAGKTRRSPQQNPMTPHLSGRHFLGAELRVWRLRRELSVAELARRIFVSRELLQKIETAQRRASLDLIRACDTVLDTSGALHRLLDFVEHAERAPAPQPQLTRPAPTSLLIRITAELVLSPASTDRSAAWPAGEGLATIYPLADRRRHRIGTTPEPQVATAGLAHPPDTDREALDGAD